MSLSQIQKFADWTTIGVMLGLLTLVSAKAIFDSTIPFVAHIILVGIGVAAVSAKILAKALADAQEKSQ
ncbi:MAG: hypothetical protein RLN72_01760 [Henriciella sp.]